MICFLDLKTDTLRLVKRGATWAARWPVWVLMLLLSACSSATPIPPTAPLAAVSSTPSPSPKPAATQTVTPLPTQPPTFTPTPSPSPSPSPSATPTTTASPRPTPTGRPSATAVPAGDSLPPAVTKAVVLIIIDGARWSETFGDPTREWIPHLANDLAPLGATNTAFYNEAATLSVPSHAAIVTGAWQTLPNDGTMRPTAPTIFEYYRQATGAPESEAIFVHGSFIEPVLTYSTHPAYGAGFGAGMFFSNEPMPPYDDGMWANARQVLVELQPRLLVISLLDPDEAAHEGRWDNYRQAIRHDDEIIWDLWQQLQADPFYAGQTSLLVTNDHGRGCGEGWANHGGDDECNRHVMFLAVGPDIRPGLVVERRRTLRDIAPTVGYLLGFDTPLAEGEVMTELLAR